MFFLAYSSIVFNEIDSSPSKSIMENSYISLTTDYGVKNFYFAGVILFLTCLKTSIKNLSSFMSFFECKILTVGRKYDA